MPSTPVSNRLHFNDHTEYLVYSTFMDYWDFHSESMVEITPVIWRLTNMGLEAKRAFEYLEKLVARGALLFEKREPGNETGKLFYGPNGMAHGQQY